MGQQDARTPTAGDKEAAVGRVDVDGVGIEYDVAGEGPPVVLLHGFPDSGRLWRHQAPALTAIRRGPGPARTTADRPGNRPDRSGPCPGTVTAARCHLLSRRSPCCPTDPVTGAEAGGLARRIGPIRSFRYPLGYQILRISHFFHLIFEPAGIVARCCLTALAGTITALAGTSNPLPRCAARPLARGAGPRRVRGTRVSAWWDGPGRTSSGYPRGRRPRRTAGPTGWPAR